MPGRTILLRDVPPADHMAARVRLAKNPGWTLQDVLRAAVAEYGSGKWDPPAKYRRERKT